MPMRFSTRLLLTLSTLTATTLCQAAERNCTQNRLDGTKPPSTQFMVYPAQTVVPFYQWQSNNGYCGEVSMIQAGLNHGQWMSQFNARLVCGTGLSQSGPRGWCKSHDNQPHHNAQLLLETPGTGFQSSFSLSLPIRKNSGSSGYPKFNDSLRKRRDVDPSGISSSDGCTNRT